MFNVHQCEKEIALGILKREIGVKNLSIDNAAYAINIDTKMLAEIFKNHGEFYAFHTLIFWAEIIAASCTSEDILDRKINRKVSKCPHDPFYREVWRFIASFEEEEKNQDIENNQNKD